MTNWTKEYPTIYADILRKPHVLIAGATGSGKSVLLNGLIGTVCFTGGTLILIDPKMVELYQWKDLPCVRCYADTVQKSVAALKVALRLIDERYKACRMKGLVKTDASPIYVCIDELADLMTTAKKEVLPLLQRIGQIGRGANVHLLACTQCVNTTVLPTQLLVNFDCRICLKTATAHHSRMVIGQSGAELFPNPCTEGKAIMWLMMPEGLKKWVIPMIGQTDIKYLVKGSIAASKRRRYA